MQFIFKLENDLQLKTINFYKHIGVVVLPVVCSWQNIFSRVIFIRLVVF